MSRVYYFQQMIVGIGLSSSNGQLRQQDVKTLLAGQI